jgi:hypothetical protein
VALVGSFTSTSSVSEVSFARQGLRSPFEAHPQIA